MIQNVDWLFTISQDKEKHEQMYNIVLLLLDSGAFDHVCPKDFAKTVAKSMKWLELMELSYTCTVPGR